MCVRFERELGKIERWARRLDLVSSGSAMAPGDETFPGAMASIVVPAESQPAWMAAAWGIVPPWAKDPKFGKQTYNARGETVDVKPSFREAFRRRRCLIPATGFYERADGNWIRIATADAEAFAMAGLFELPNGVSSQPTFTMVTTEPNLFMEPYQDRMPVILAAEDYEQWLDPAATVLDLKTLLRPCPDDWLVAANAGPVGKKKGA